MRSQRPGQTNAALPSIPDEDVRTRLAAEADGILARAADLEAQAVEATGL